MSDSTWVSPTTDETFQADVIERSSTVPVVVDFWASWCQPCMALAPLLESLAEEYAGKFHLVKAETDYNPEAAGQFNVESIPAVYAVADGQIVDFFAGVVPEPALREWLDGVVAHGELIEMKQREESDPAAAEAYYRELLAASPNHAEANAGIARTLLLQGKADQCQAWIDELESRGFLEPDVEQVKAQLHLAGSQNDDIAALQAAAEADPENYQAQLALAQAEARIHQYEAALARCLGLVERDRRATGETARQLMVDVFRVLGDDHELTATYRRRLSMALY
ncbi:MAG: tetratricopeptide repeat protein [Pirellulaceae bacterium]|jgi:putative thioredoxin|nr:tetratricopeptide repeat protein [Pirellulaceae bacterium]MDP7020582.1 tetratricopeptide repeat protein [Pirellulaceae bacterium]